MQLFKIISLFYCENEARAVFQTSILKNGKTIYERSRTYRPSGASVKRLAATAYRHRIAAGQHKQMRLVPNLVSVGWTLSGVEEISDAK